MDVIFALATASGRAGVAIIRISGAGAIDGLLPFIPKLDGVRFTPQVRKFKNKSGDLIDRPMVLVFSEGRSFTGEQTVELHLHGSPAIVKTVMAVLEDIDLFRLAEPGEFTRRALMNNKMNLDEVEGLGDLIDAETEVQLAQARKLLDGQLREKSEKWRNDLIHAGALLQATIDFADEDVPEDVLPDVDAILSPLRKELYKENNGLVVSERIRDGFEIAILGAPNAGKSTLLNHLSRRDVSIVSEFAGTTRDVIEVRMDLFGYPVTFLDTAGIRTSTDVVEGIGIKLAEDRAKQADLRVWIKSSIDDLPLVEMQPFDIQVLGKDDSGTNEQGLSGVTGAGIDRFLAEIKTVLDQKAATVGAATHERHGVALRAAAGFVDSALDGLKTGTEIELVADDLRLAAGAIDTLIGRVDVEDVLDKVFASFCLGK